MNPASMRQQAECVRNRPLPSVLLSAGAAADPYDKARWHTAKGVISVTGMKFFNWNRGVGGGGAIDLVIHLYDLDFKGAVAWLQNRLPNGHPASAPPDAPQPKLKLPEPRAEGLATVRDYLLDQRRLRPAVVDRLIGSGNIYADDHANAVFLLRGKRNAPVGAELRGTGPHPWRGMAPGSRKDLGCFCVRDTSVDAVILCESAIDAISALLIHPRRCCISTAGARPNPAWLPALLRRRLPILCGFDADPTGDAIAQSMIERYPAIQRLRPPRHDWNDLLRSTP